MDKYWMVHNPNTGHKPKVKYTIQKDAEREATRLAQQRPGESFVLLEAMKVYKADLPVTVEDTLTVVTF